MIIQVVPAISIEASGPVYSVRRLCEALREAGVDVCLAALDWSPMNGVPEYARLFPLGMGPRRLGRSPSLACWLKEEASAGHIRLLHNHGLWMMPNVYPGWVARRFELPYVVSARGTLGEWPFHSGSPIKRVFWPLVQKPALSVVTCWHATSQAEYEDIRRMGFRQPVAVIPNGMDLPPLLPKEFHQLRTLLYLGRLHPKKGLDWLLRAWVAVEARFPALGHDDGAPPAGPNRQYGKPSGQCPHASHRTGATAEATRPPPTASVPDTGFSPWADGGRRVGLHAPLSG